MMGLLYTWIPYYVIRYICYKVEYFIFFKCLFGVKIVAVFNYHLGLKINIFQLKIKFY